MQKKLTYLFVALGLVTLTIWGVVSAHPTSGLGVQVTPTHVQTPFDTIPRFCNPPNVPSVIVNARDGSWSDPATWQGGQVPAANDGVQIAQGTTVTYDANSGIPLNCIEVQGTLSFATNTTTKLVLNELMVMPQGALIVGTPSSPIANTVTAEIVIRDTPLNTTLDPKQYGQSLIVYGDATMHGARMSPTWIRLGSEPRAGNTTLTLAQAPSGWKSGDRLVLPDTRSIPEGFLLNRSKRYNPEYVTIASISGNQVTLTAPLQSDHLGALDGDGVTVRFLPHVGNLTRNVIIRSENPAGTPGHAMFLHRAQVNLRYVLFRNMGRTSSALLNNTTFDAQGNVSHIGTNQIGRYAAHMHHLWGPVNPGNSGYQFELIGNAIDIDMSLLDSKWGFTIHDSHYGLIQDNVVSGIKGAGFVTEDGSESYNLFERNFGLHGAGHEGPDDWVTHSSDDEARAGSAFWWRGSNNQIRDNVAANGARNAFAFYPKDAPDIRIPLFRGADMLSSAETALSQVRRQPILEFTGNEAYNSFFGLLLYGNQGAHTIENFSVWNPVRSGLHGNYMNRFLEAQNLTIRGHRTPPTTSKPAGVTHDIYSKLHLNNFDIQTGLNPGIYLISWQSNTIENGVLKTPTNIVYSYSPPNGPPFTTAQIRNVTFEAPAGAPLLAVETRMSKSGMMVEKTELLIENYNQTPGDNFQVYFREQDPAFVIPTGRGCPTDALTNAQCYSQHGIAVAGGVASCTDSTTRPEFKGFTCGGATSSSSSSSSSSSTPANQAPSVNAGVDLTITLPASATLNATVSDDGLPNPPGTVTTTWSKVSGPGTVTFGSPSIVDTTAIFSLAGTYVLRLTANDGTLTTNDSVQVTVNASAPVNQAPSVSAGADMTITLPSSASLNGTVTDDGLPNPPGSVTTTWSKVSGPGTVTFGNMNAVDTTASFSVAGTYVLQLGGDDNALSTSDTVQVIVNAATPGNSAPQITSFTNTTVDRDTGRAGIQVFAGETIIYSASASDADGDTLSWTWYLSINGAPGVQRDTGQGAIRAQTYTYPSGSAGSSYRWVLHVSDGKGPAVTDEVTIDVIASPPTNLAPSAAAGADQTITLPASALLDGTVTDDNLPNPPGTVTTTWSKFSGPGTVTFGNSNAVDTTASFSVAGTYVLRLTADDGTLSANDSVSVTVTAGDTTAPVISAILTPNITSASVTIEWTTDEQSDSQVEFGTTTSYGSSSTVDATPVTSHTTVLSNLNANTLYHFRVKSRDSAGNLATSPDNTVRTDSAVSRDLCVKISLENQQTHNMNPVAVRVIDQLTGQVIFSTSTAASDAQGKIFLNDPAIQAATAGAHYTIAAKPDTFFKRGVKDVDIAASLGGNCTIIPTVPFGDVKADGRMGIDDLVDAIQHYRGITIHATLDQLFGAGNFRIAHLVWMIRQFVTLIADEVGL